MKIFFFEWADYEELIERKFNIPISDTIVKISDSYSNSWNQPCECISIKSKSILDQKSLNHLRDLGCKKILLRIAGFNNVDVEYATSLGMEVYRVAGYSPESIAEYTIMLILTLARKYNNNFQNLIDGTMTKQISQMGFLLEGKTLGLHGYGKIARHVAHIARNGFGMKIKFYDKYFDDSSVDARVDTLEQLYFESDIVSIHIPLNEETKHVVDKSLFTNVRPEFMLINTSRGEILKSNDIKELFKAGTIKYLGVDVWGADDRFDYDIQSNNSFQSYHVAFFTEEAVKSMIEQTMESLNGRPRPENILPIQY